MASLRCLEPGTAQRVLSRCCFAAGILALVMSRAGADEVERALILDSNESLLPANIALGNALVGQLRAKHPERCEFFSDFLDLVRFSGEAHQRQTVAALQTKYSGGHIDLIIPVGPQALEVPATYHDTLSPGVPLVFAGIRTDSPVLQKLTAPTGILMRLDPVPTPELALRRQPATRRIVVVTVDADFDRGWESVARDCFRSYEDRLQFIYLSGQALPQLPAESRTLGPEAIVFYLSILEDGAGQSFIPAEVATLVAAASAVPVYGLYDTYLGFGIVGGCMNTFTHLGLETARLGLRVLAKERTESIAPYPFGDVVQVVDSRQLRRRGLSEGLLPPESEVRFRQPSLWETHRGTVLTAAAVVALQSALIFGLLFQRRNRRRAEQEVRRQKELFRSVVEATPSAIVMANAAGIIVLVNAQTEKAFGYRREELAGRPVEILLPGRIRARHPDYRADFATSPPRPEDHDLYCRHKDGSEVPVEISLTPIQTEEGNFVLTSIVDITEREEVEGIKQQLTHAARLATVGKLMAAIAHEINQPLGAILSNVDAAEMLLDSSPESLDDVRHILDDIRKDDLRASEVIRRLRTLLRRGEMEMRPFDPNEVISEVLGLIGAESGRRGLAVETDLVADLPLVRGDKVHLQQVLLNLFLNGMEAMADVNGAKRLTVRTCLDTNGWVEIAVSDVGHGIAPDQVPRLFDPFFSTKREGMGLGLSIARSIIEAHGGRIWAENNPRGGSTFRFTVPTAARQPVEESPETQGTPMELHI